MSTKSKIEKGFRGYIFSRPFMEERVPQHVQNIVIRDYCSKKGIHYLLSATEYAMDNSSLILNHTLKFLPFSTLNTAERMIVIRYLYFSNHEIDYSPC